MIFVRYLIVLACFAYSFHALAEAEDDPKKLVFSQIIGSPIQEESVKALRVLYSRLGIETEFVSLPARRALESSNSGKTDGEVFRILNIDKRYPNLVRVPTILHTFNGFAYTKSGKIFNTWKEMKNYRVGLLHGVVWAEKETIGYNVVRLSDYDELLDKLVSGGIDIAIGTDFSFDREVRRKGIKIKFYRGKPLRSLNVYHYLHKDNKALIERVNTEIKMMTKTGAIEKITGIPYVAQ